MICFMMTFFNPDVILSWFGFYLYRHCRYEMKTILMVRFQDFRARLHRLDCRKGLNMSIKKDNM